jgi:uncharacterized protein YqeY
MSLEQKVTTALVSAMKSKDQGALRALRGIKAEILLFKTSGSGETLDDKAETRILQKMVKQRKDSLAIYKEQARADLAEKEEEEIAVIERFLPEPLGEAELKSFVSSLIRELNATSMKDMGRVMSEASARLAGRADGKTIASIVKELLSQ